MVLLAVAPVASATKFVDFWIGGESSGSVGGEFSAPRDVATRYSTGQIYVADSSVNASAGNHRVQRFAADGAFERAWGANVVGRDERQRVAVTATGGTYTLTFDGQTTGNIAYNASSGTVDNALDVLSSIGGDANVAVSGNLANGYTVTFQGTLSGTDVPELTANAAGLTGPGAGVAISTLTEGAGGVGTDFEICTDAALCRGGVASGGNVGNNLRNGALSTPAGVAVNQGTGHVYVRDAGNARVSQFDADGNFVRSFGWDVVQPGEPGEATAPLNEVQQVSLSHLFGTVTGGTFTLSFGATAPTTTAPIAWNASSSAVQSALEALGDIGASDVQVTGGDGGPWTVTFVNALGAQDVAQLVGDASALTGTGFFASVNVQTTVQGTPNAPAYEVCEAPAACKAGVNGALPGQFGNGTQGAGIDVQASTGDVFVADPANRRIQRFAADGDFISAFGGPSQFTSSNHPQHVAVSADGIVYATDGANRNELERYDLGTGSFLDPVPGDALLATLNNSTSGGLEIDPGTGNLFVARVPGNSSSPDPFAVLELSNPGGAAPTIVDQHVPGTSTTGIGSNGIGFNAGNGNLMIATSNIASAGGHRVFVADEDGAPPAEVHVLPASNVTQSGATVRAEIDTAGPFATGWKLQVSRNGNDWLTVSDGTLSAGSSATVTGEATGLLPNTLYRVRALTQKEYGNPEVPSAELTFLTDAAKPEVRTTAVRELTDDTAVVSARINPHSTSTTYRVEWGQGQFTTVTPVPDEPVGNGPHFVLVSQQLAPLKPNTTYQFRFVANSVTEGTTTGPTKTFTTAAEPQGAAGRTYEMVSPPDKLGGQGAGNWYAGPGSFGHTGMAGYEGERFAVRAEKGGVLLDGAYSFASDFAFAERQDGATGWTSHSPVSHPGYGDHSFRFLNMSGATDDLSRILWASSTGAYKAFPEMEPWPATVDPQYIGDWAGRWEIFGPTDPGQIALDSNGVVDASNGRLSAAVLSADGTTVAGTTVLRGLGGPADPTLTLPSPVVGLDDDPRNLYVGDVSSPPADTLAGTGSRFLANVCTSGTTVPEVGPTGEMEDAGCTAGQLISNLGASQHLSLFGRPRSATKHVISADGSRVFFMSPDPIAAGVPSGVGGSGCDAAGETCPPQLYVRQEMPNGSVATRWISRAVDGLFGSQDATLTGRVVFEGASEDGDKVLFKTNSPLTIDDPNGGSPVPGGVTTGTASSDSWDLYLYDFPDDDDDPGSGTLTRVSAGPTGQGDGNGLQSSATEEAIARFVSADASRVYFVTSAPLPGVSGAGNGTITEPGGTPTTANQTNLYLYDSNRPAAQRWSFVARLPRAVEGPDACASTGVVEGAPLRGSTALAAGEPTLGAAQRNCVSGTSDGSFVTFWTRGRLTADDPDSVTADVYAYDADADDLTRISAAQGGAAGTYVCTGAVVCNADGGMDTPDYTGAVPPLPVLGVATDPPTEGDRIAFFQSRSRLVPEDLDDVYDVYQWRNGELSLVSTGQSATDGAVYRGNDASGQNVFIATLDKLSWQDVDAVPDVYTARVGGGIAQPPPPVVCGVLVDACQGAGAASAPVQPKTTSSAGSPQDDNASPGVRKSLRVGKPSKRARRRAVRTGTLAVAVRVSEAGKVRAVAKGRIGKRTRRVARKSVQVRKAGKAMLRLRLNRVARQRLSRGKALKLSIKVTSPGTRSRSITVRLPGGKS